MRCTRCFKEFEEEEIAYATATGSIEQSELDEELGFYASEIESWITVLCEDCGMAIHNFIANELQAKHLSPTPKRIQKKQRMKKG
jgi:hypothetical protein